MSEAKRDNNYVPTVLAVLNTDGATPKNVIASPTTHAIFGDDGVAGVDHGDGIAIRDENRVPVFIAVSSADGVTPVMIYADSDGHLQINSN